MHEPADDGACVSRLAERVATICLEAIGSPLPPEGRVDFVGDGAFASAFPVTGLAAGTIAAAASAIAALVGQCHGRRPAVRVDRRLASYWFQRSIDPIGWTIPEPWDPIAGDYACRDGWIRLHTNAPLHRAAAERVLGTQADRAAMARAVAAWDGEALETAIVVAGGCAAQMRAADDWAVHPQGRAVAAEPLAIVETTACSTPARWPVPPARPLQGIRVLDLTRVLAGPVATRFLAGFGAEVLRIDPPAWDEPAIVPEVTLGKRCARLDLRRQPDRATFETLLAGADVLLHGYRPGALDELGFDATARRRIAPGLVDVSLDAWGWSGPWATRRGFDSLVQMSSGIAHAGMAWRGVSVPTPLPVQALDHATGYLLAACAVRGIGTRLAEGRATRARLSLARTAALLLELRPHAGAADGAAGTGTGTGAGALASRHAPTLAPADDTDFADSVEHTAWGDARRLRAPVDVDGAALCWVRAARRLGSDAAAWSA